MNVELLAEPELQFGSEGRHVDIRFGIKNYGPVTWNDPSAPREIKIGLVGTSASIEGVKNWLKACKDGVPAKASKKPNLFPEFPGFSKDGCFRCEWVLASNLEGAISQRDIELIIENEGRSAGIPRLVQLFMSECQRLCEKGQVDVLVCAPPQNLFKYTDAVSSAEDGDDDDPPFPSKREEVDLDFHDLLKARGIALSRPIQLVRPITYDDNAVDLTGRGTARQLQDPATRAWNFHTALYYKAGGTPWRLIRSTSDLMTCYVGIGFYKSLDREKTHTSIAQVFNERGEGMVLRGGEATISELDRQPHLSKKDIASLVNGVLNSYHGEHKHWPARVVIHKTSLFDENEIAGCNAALDSLKISSRDLLTVRSSFIRLFRAGQYPPLRGTFLTLDSQRSVLYTRGSVDFYQMYPGMYVPRSIEIVDFGQEQHPRVLAQEILALTKMNWNNTQFDAAFPITIKAAREVGKILRYAETNLPIQKGYPYYM
jgi:hypothetical protein